MSDKSDHLIERAAALLRAASSPTVDRPPPRPAPRPPSIVPPTAPPLYGASARAGAAGTVPVAAAPQPLRSRPSDSRHLTSASIGSVEEIGHFSHPAVTLDALEAAGLMV